MIRSGAGVWLFANEDATWEQPRITGPRDVDLVAGFNLVAWTGPGTVAAAAVAGITAALDSLFMWDAPAEEFLTFGPERPDLLSRVDALAYGEGFWLLMTDAAAWAQPDVGPEIVITSQDGRVALTIPPGGQPAGRDRQRTSASRTAPRTRRFSHSQGPRRCWSCNLSPAGCASRSPSRSRHSSRSPAEPRPSWC